MLHYLSKIRYAYKYAVCNNQLFSIVVSPDLAKHFIEMKTISIYSYTIVKCSIYVMFHLNNTLSSVSKHTV